MRFLWFIILAAIIVATVAFTLQNNEEVRLQFFHWGATASMALIIGAVYVLGMISGWTVVGLFKRSLHEVTARRDY